METLLLIIYCAIAIRSWIAVRLNDFKEPEHRLFIEDEELKQRATASANFYIFCMTFFWPAFLVIYPMQWIDGILLGRRCALNDLSFKFGYSMGRFFSQW